MCCPAKLDVLVPPPSAKFFVLRGAQYQGGRGRTHSVPRLSDSSRSPCERPIGCRCLAWQLGFRAPRDAANDHLAPIDRWTVPVLLSTCMFVPVASIIRPLGRDGYSWSLGPFHDCLASTGGLVRCSFQLFLFFFFLSFSWNLNQPPRCRVG